MWILISILVILIFALGLSVYANYNVLRKLDEYEEFCVMLQTTCKDILIKVKQIDERGAFETDDEVGDVYNDIRTQLIRLRNFIGEE